MTLLNFKQRMVDELEGAKHYIQDAINLKQARPAWAKNFADMSEMELSHARRLLDMFNALYAERYGGDDPMEEIRADIMDEYTAMYSEVMRMHEIYKM